MKHTKEPWYISGTSPVMVISNSATIAKCCGIRIGTKESVQAEIEANAIRIVACVNACAGIDEPEEVIHGMRFEIDSLKRWRDGEHNAIDYWIATGLKASQQRDELLAALNNYAAHHAGCDWYGYGTELPHSGGECSCGLIEAIAKAGKYDTNTDAIPNCDKGDA